MRDETDGGPGRVLRCKTRLVAALAAVKSVDFFPLYAFSLLFCSLGRGGDKRHVNIGRWSIRTSSECLKCQQQGRLKK